MLSLAAAVIPSAESEEVSGKFKVTLGPDGFCQEAHVKLRPVDFAAEGVFLCGTAPLPEAHPGDGEPGIRCRRTGLSPFWPTIRSPASGSVCRVTEEQCMGCGVCASACTYGAIEIHKTKQGHKAQVIPVLCKGCGLCNAKCPTGAIQLKHYTDLELTSQIIAAGSACA